MPDDPYDFAPRDQAKLALLIAINARSHSSAVRALADALRQEGGVGDPYATAQKLLRVAKARHPDIAWALASDAGVRLMRQDSELAERIMLETVRAIGIVPLAVHDSFIVPASQKGRLMDAMEDAISSKSLVEANAKIPCGSTPHFGDSFSSLPSTVSPNLLPQYGREKERSGVGVGGSGMDRPGELQSLLEAVGKLSPEVRMLALGLKPYSPAVQATEVVDVRVTDARQIEATPVSAPEPVPSAETARTPPSVTDRSSEAVGSRRCAVCGDDLYRCFPLKCPLKSASNSVAEGV
jgi:hypothetical protein